MFGRLGLFAAVVVAGTTLVAPAPASADSITNRMVTNIAHRGASLHAPENTIAAFRLAQVEDADMFELDVQETKDHALVVMHDTTLARTTDVESVYPGRSPWNVSSFTLEEIRKLDAGSWFGPRYRGERVPTLGESLSAMRSSGLGVLLEVKSPELYPGIEQRVADELRRHPYWLWPDRSRRALVVQSFNAGSLRRFHGIMPDVPIGLLGTPAVADLPELARFADYINPSQADVNAAYVRSVRAQRMEMFTWTVNDPAAMRRLIAAGVDGIITDNPDMLDDILDPDQAAAAA